MNARFPANDEVMQRRRFLQGLASVGAASALGSSFWQSAFALPAVPGDGPYGPLGPPDLNGIRLPAGFTSAVVAESLKPVKGTLFPWVLAPDGAATFPMPDGGWVLACNSEVPVAGGVGAIRYHADGTVKSAYRILTGTSVNCAGGPTPWGTWLSCEEFDIAPGVAGMVWECDPSRVGQGVPRPALGRFSHEAACVDPVGRRVYLSEDQGDGRFYRFTPAVWGKLDKGVLEAASVGAGGAVSWVPVPDPLALRATTRAQTAGVATDFDGGEGLWWDEGVVYLSTKGDKRIWAYDTVAGTIDTVYNGEPVGPDAATTVTPDNLVVSRGNELFAGEDSGRRNRIAVLTGVPGAPSVAPFLEVIERAPRIGDRGTVLRPERAPAVLLVPAGRVRYGTATPCRACGGSPTW